jgi:hypothetical protein
MQLVSKLKSLANSIRPRIAVTFGRAAIKGRKRYRGFWDHAAYRPERTDDPAKLEWVVGRAGILLPATDTVRLYRPEHKVSDKLVKRLIRSLYFLQDRDGLRELDRLLFGGGQAWQAGYENLVVNQGLDHILDVVLSGATQDTTWFVGLLDDDAAPGATWTATEIAGDDFVNYDESTLQAFTDGGVSGQSVDNSASPATFTCSTNSSVVGGAFLIGTNAKATPAGDLYAAGTFTGGDKNLDDGDSLETTCTFTSADDGA